MYFLEGEFKAGQVIVPEILAHIERLQNKIVSKSSCACEKVA